MSKTRYRADWTIDLGKQGEGDFNIDLVNYGSKYFTNLRKAQLFAYKHDFYNVGRVYVEEFRTDYDPSFGAFSHWCETGEDYFIDGPELKDVEKIL